MNDLKHYYELHIRVEGGPKFDQLSDKDQLKLVNSIGFAAFKLQRATTEFNAAMENMIHKLPKINRP